MKKGMSKLLSVLLIVIVAAGIMAGCGESTNNAVKSETTALQTPAPAEDTQKTGEIQVIEDIQVWDENNANKALEKGSPLYEKYMEMFGVGVLKPTVEWNGGTSYQNTLNMKIAAGEMPDVFLPTNGSEVELMKNGALADLTDLLPQYAPSLWKIVPQEVWETMKSMDPSGKNRIYLIPAVQDYVVNGMLIRKDWLDKVGLDIPKTQAELVNVLKAFRDKDPNGNSQKDELPTIGRENGTWMDYLFAMYGVAMNTDPEWDIYNGELTYAAVTPNMKAALEFVSELYKDKLIDSETFLNKKDVWEAKIRGDKVGLFYHIPDAVNGKLVDIKKINPDVEIVSMPLPKVEGYTGFIAQKKVNRINYVFKNQSEERVIAGLKVLEGVANPDNYEKHKYRIEGEDYVVKNGARVESDVEKTKLTNFLNYTFLQNLGFKLRDMASEPEGEKKWAVNMAMEAVKADQVNGKIIASDGMPATIYDGYTDIKNKVLFNEYMSKIIIGSFPISKFDEFVQKWNKAGGEEVTKRAREWYAKKTQK